jgi:hypothetical protein
MSRALPNFPARGHWNRVGLSPHRVPPNTPRWVVVQKWRKRAQAHVPKGGSAPKTRAAFGGRRTGAAQCSHSLTCHALSQNAPRVVHGRPPSPPAGWNGNHSVPGRGCLPRRGALRPGGLRRRELPWSAPPPILSRRRKAGSGPSMFRGQVSGPRPASNTNSTFHTRPGCRTTAESISMADDSSAVAEGARVSRGARTPMSRRSSPGPSGWTLPASRRWRYRAPEASDERARFEGMAGVSPKGSGCRIDSEAAPSSRLSPR